MKNKKKSLLIITDSGGIIRYYYGYKHLIKNKFKVRQIKPYVLEFPKKLSEEEMIYISEILNKTGAKYEWFRNVY